MKNTNVISEVLPPDTEDSLPEISTTTSLGCPLTLGFCDGPTCPNHNHGNTEITCKLNPEAETE